MSAHRHRIWRSETTTGPLQIWCYEFDYAPVITPKSRWEFELEKIHEGSDRASKRTCIRQIFKKVAYVHFQVHASKIKKDMRTPDRYVWVISVFSPISATLTTRARHREPVWIVVGIVTGQHRGLGG